MTSLYSVRQTEVLVSDDGAVVREEEENSKLACRKESVLALIVCLLCV